MKAWFDSVVRKLPENHAVNQPFLVSSAAIIYCLQKLDKLGLNQSRLEKLLRPLLKLLRLKPDKDGNFPGYKHLCHFVPVKDR